MKKFAVCYQASFQELKHVKTLTTAAMLMAVSVVLGYFTIEAGPYLKIGFGGVVNQFVYYLFGPVAGAVYGGVLDLVKYVVKPTGAFFPGFTLNAMLGGVLYGTILYRKPLTFRRALWADLVLENLDGKKRDVILRYYFLGFDDTEISKILEVNRSTIQRRRHAGLEFIKKFMEEEA